MIESSESENKKKNSIWLYINLAIGSVLGQFVGVTYIIPILMPFVVWFIVSRVVKGFPRHLFVLPFSIQAAHTLWMYIGFMVKGSFIDTTWDMLIIALTLIWLISKPSIYPTIILLFSQVVAAVVNGFTAIDYDFHSLEFKSLVLSIAFRVYGTVELINAYLAFSKSKQISVIEINNSV